MIAQKRREPTLLFPVYWTETDGLDEPAAILQATKEWLRTCSEDYAAVVLDAAHRNGGGGYLRVTVDAYFVFSQLNDASGLTNVQMAIGEWCRGPLAWKYADEISASDVATLERPPTETDFGLAVLVNTLKGHAWECGRGRYVEPFADRVRALEAQGFDTTAQVLNDFDPDYGCDPCDT